MKNYFKQEGLNMAGKSSILLRKIFNFVKRGYDTMCLS